MKTLDAWGSRRGSGSSFWLDKLGGADRGWSL